MVAARDLRGFSGQWTGTATRLARAPSANAAAAQQTAPSGMQDQLPQQ